MPSVNCSFCDHANPADAKFCNECGAGLGLRPCVQCEAINDVAATLCHQCGTLLGAAVTAVASAANVEGAHAAPSSPLMRPQPSGASATDTAGASLPEVGAGKTAFASPRELASAAERLDAFWRDSMQAVEVARAMKGDVTPPPPPQRSVDMLPLRVVDDTPVIDAGPDPGAVLRRGPRLAIAAALLVVAAGVVYYGYERTSVRSAAVATPVTTPAVIAAPTPSAPVIIPAPASAERAANDAQVTTAPTVSNASTGPSADADRGPTASSSTATSEASVPAPAVANAAAPDAPLAPDASATTTGPMPAAARPQADQPTGAAATAPAAAAPRASARDSRTRIRSSRAPTAPRYPVPAARPMISPIPPPVARTPVMPAPSASSCTDSTAALGLCSR